MRAGVVRPMETSGRWTLKVCQRCKENRQMPENDEWCGQCLYPEPKLPPPEFRVSLPGLKAARLRSGISQSELARRVWINATSIKNYENRKYRADKQVAEAIASALGVFLEELVYEQEIEVQGAS